MDENREQIHPLPEDASDNAREAAAAAVQCGAAAEPAAADAGQKKKNAHGKRRGPAGENSPAKRLKRLLYRFAGGILAAASVVTLLWMTVNVHPDAAIAASESSAQMRVNIISQLDSYSDKVKSDAVSTLHRTVTSYSIPESASAAPVPDGGAFGETQDPQVMLEVIAQAREYGLLGEEEAVVFSASFENYRETPMKYYCDETILVLLWKEKIDGRVCSFAEIKLADASQFRRKLTEDTYGSAVRSYATQMADEVNAVVAMNADLYAQRDLGITVYNRQVYRLNEWPYNAQYSQYNAIDNLFIDGNGDFLFLHKGEEVTREALQQIVDERDIRFSIAFGPILVENGELQTCDWYPCGEVDLEYSRAGIAQVDTLHYLYMAVSHSPSGTPRCNINQFAKMFYDKGVQQAYALDGGQTGELVFNGEAYNFIDFGAERAVSDIIYFGTALGAGEGGNG